MADPGPIMLAAACLILLGVLANKASDRLGVPALLLFLAIGMLAGSDGLGGIEFSDGEVAQAVGVVALAFILFAGGLETSWPLVRIAAGRAVALATVGVLATALAVGVVAMWALDVTFLTGLLLGAIVSSTDAAAVFAVLGSQKVGLRSPLRPLLELESGSNDPMAVFLTVSVLTLLTEPDRAVVDLIPLFIVQMSVGAVVGYLGAKGGLLAINRLRLGYEGLYPVALIALVLLVYGSAAVLGGSGFLAVFVAGLVMGNAPFLHKRSLMRFADGLAWLMQIAMFLVLGLLVFPSDLPAVAGQALIISGALILVARPLATLLVLLPTRFGLRPSLLVSWVGLRGAAPIILATFPLVEGIESGDTIFNVVFFIVLTSVLVQGTSIPLVARWLGVDTPLPAVRRDPLEYLESSLSSADLHDIAVPDDSRVAGLRLFEIGIPSGALVVLVGRDDHYVVPQGSTTIEAGDNVLVLADEAALARTRALLDAPAGG